MTGPTTPPTRHERRPSSAPTRERILEAARNQFADKGFEHTTVRSIAAAAGVDSALVHHYFGTKQRLLVEAIAVPWDPVSILEPLVAVPVDALGEALARTVIGVWDSAHQAAVVAAARSVLTGGREDLIRSALLDVVLRDIIPRVDSPKGTGELRAALVASQMTGLFLTRHLLRIDALSNLDTEEVTRLIAPTLQRYLTGPLDQPDQSTDDAIPRAT
ncbi:TetR/AcrR family transcriptional regulator [Rhodococcus spongiicola]|uniref:TetR/AcrR family transcriptional regulator n=1 Tax=Rhodococcus spongiicola TaxID=2487352 RepID=A0A3S3AH94_9NOCA|nr:TetR family transcriptional regulator [Rhodococcus spongiicola]RVW00500.1 TetR/AcrR family transcriptional regulator [Rhodococcus spongiicola]